MENDFLNDFKNTLIELPQAESENFVKTIEDNVKFPSEVFLHNLCRKIDIKKILYVSYDKQKDLVPTSDKVISNNDWLKITYILSYWAFGNVNSSVKYKALNTLLKTRDIMPKECLTNKFVAYIFNKQLINIL